MKSFTTSTLRLAVAGTLAVAFSVALSGCAIVIHSPDGEVSFGTGPVIQGDGQVIKEIRQIASVTGLDIANSRRIDMKVDVKVGASPSLEIEADTNLLPLIRSDINGNTVKIWVDGNLRSSNPIRVTYTLPEVNRINAHGSTQLVVSGLNGAALEIEQHGAVTSQLSGRVSELEITSHGSSKLDGSALQSGNTKATLRGSSRAQLGAIQGEKLKVVVSGSGSFNGKGTVQNLNASTSGSADINLSNLSSANADLMTSGSSEISAKATQAVVAHTSGTGRITVLGNPAQRTVNGSRVSFTQ